MRPLVTDCKGVSARVERRGTVGHRMEPWHTMRVILPPARSLAA